MAVIVHRPLALLRRKVRAHIGRGRADGAAVGRGVSGLTPGGVDLLAQMCRHGVSWRHVDLCVIYDLC